jgi:hypothetical protein
MGKWKKYNVHDRSGEKVLTFRAKKVKKMKPVKAKDGAFIRPMGFSPPMQERFCTCPPGIQS